MDDASQAGPSKVDKNPKRKRKDQLARQGGHDSTSKKRKTTVTKIINDPIWGPIELHPLCIKIIDTPWFQRLRSIKQLGGCSFVYPGACHSRFEHSIGTAYLARKLGQELQRTICPQHTNGIEITDKEILCLEVAGLCHDLGHGPFSHLFDLQFFKKARPGVKWEHEDAAIQMIDRIFGIIEQNYVNDDEKKFIKDLIKQTDDTHTELRETKPFLYEIIANNLSKIDVDKWDYFSRDCHMLGLHHNFQCERSIQLARIVDHGGKYHISFPKSEYFNLFDMFFTRFTLHRRAYQHPVTKAVEMMIADAFFKADKSLKFPPNQPDQKCLSESVYEMDAYLWVTDDVLNQIRNLNPDGNEDIKHAQRLVERIYSRDFYKLIGEKRVKTVKMPTQSRTIRSSNLTSSIAEGLKNKLKDAGNQEALFEIQMVVFNYGSGDQNPMDKVKLYAKTASGGENETSNCVENRRICTLYPKVESADISKEEISDMLPTKFEQIYSRLMWKGEKEEHLFQKLLTDFSRIKTYESNGVKVDFVDTK